MHRSQGFSLLEILLAWFILMSTLLGLLAMQIQQMRHVRHAYLFSVATIQLQSMAERLRVNATAAARFRELQSWNAENQKILPAGSGDFICQNDTCTITLHWQEGHEQWLTLTTAL